MKIYIKPYRLVKFKLHIDKIELLKKFLAEEYTYDDLVYIASCAKRKDDSLFINRLAQMWGTTPNNYVYYLRMELAARDSNDFRHDAHEY